MGSRILCPPACFSVALGRLAGDLYGRRKIFVVGVTLFAVGSAWCGVAPTITSLIVARALQGAGAALLVPGSLAIISASYSGEQRGRAIGTWSGFTAITAAIGPVLVDGLYRTAHGAGCSLSTFLSRSSWSGSHCGAFRKVEMKRPTELLTGRAPFWRPWVWEHSPTL